MRFQTYFLYFDVLRTSFFKHFCSHTMFWIIYLLFLNIAQRLTTSDRNILSDGKDRYRNARIRSWCDVIYIMVCNNNNIIIKKTLYFRLLMKLYIYMEYLHYIYEKSSMFLLLFICHWINEKFYAMQRCGFSCDIIASKIW